MDSYTGNPSDPLSLNLYTYSHNNPIMFVDTTGHWPEWLDNAWNHITQGAQQAWNHLTQVVDWKELGLSLLQVIGGGLESFAGFTTATATSATGLGIAGGMYLMVDGGSNFSGGVSRVVNGFNGNKNGDTGNYMKSGYRYLSSTLGFDPEYGEMFYNGTQLTISCIRC